jgi:hypothetical protein
LESLLGPLQYKAPNTALLKMNNPQSDMTVVYVRLPLPDMSINLSPYYPIYAADGFCHNLSQNITPITMPASSDVAYKIANTIMLQETFDSKLVANCWHFFEERVQYPDYGDVSVADALMDKSLSFKLRHYQQASRCADDFYIRHIISLAAYTDCKTNGRSTLKARADMAYRMESTEYLAYLNSLGAATRELIFAQALSEPERFEQSLLLERQIMTEAMFAAKGAPTYLGKNSPTMNRVHD